MTVDELGEHALLARILARLPRPGSDLLVGPGDDAAVLEPVRNERLVVTTDAIVEGVHFQRTFSRPADIGHKALAVNLSDLAAMGATPRWALLSLLLPNGTLVADVEDLVSGVAELAGQYGVSVAGGNITRTPGPLVVDVTVGGSAKPRRWLTRNGARPGDELYVSGTIGAAAAGLEMLEQVSGLRSQASGMGSQASENDACIERHRRPQPRVRLGVALARARVATAAMDLSDGLADALRQVATASGVGVRIEADALPVSESVRAWWHARGVDPVEAAVSGGDDYELLFSVPRVRGRALRALMRRFTDVPLTRIGVVTKDAGERALVRGSTVDQLPEGFLHFAHR